MGQPASKLTARDVSEKLAHRRMTVLELAERLGTGMVRTAKEVSEWVPGR
jgi:hypothetical protein